jgi:RNAse (barnase) inhibitor barstar
VDDEPPTYVLEGLRIHSLEDFWREIGEAVNGPGGYFASNLDALSDALAGGMGQPEDGVCTFIWENSDAARDALGYDETERQLEIRLSRCHPKSRPTVTADLHRARRREGPTVFDWLVQAFTDGPATLLLRKLRGADLLRVVRVGSAPRNRSA